MLDINDLIKVFTADEATTISKPWGKEVWLTPPEEGCGYVLKILHITAGHKTSLQYHEQKKETMFFLEGEGILHYRETKDGPTKQHRVKPGDTIQIKPEGVHRLESVTDIKFLEAQTPEVEDVVRLEDSYGREGSKEL